MEWGWSPLWPRRCRERNPDASLSARGVHATHFAGKRGAAHHGGSTGSALRPGRPTRADGSGRSPHRNTGCRGRSRNRCAPAPRTAGNCRVDTTAGLPACSPRSALDKAARHRHKGKATAPRARTHQKARDSAKNVPGPSSIQRLATAYRGRVVAVARALPLSGQQRSLRTGDPGNQSPRPTINHTSSLNERACSAAIHLTVEPRQTPESSGFRTPSTPGEPRPGYAWAAAAANA